MLEGISKESVVANLKVILRHLFEKKQTIRKEIRLLC